MKQMITQDEGRRASELTAPTESVVRNVGGRMKIGNSSNHGLMFGTLLVALLSTLSSAQTPGRSPFFSNFVPASPTFDFFPKPPASSPPKATPAPVTPAPVSSVQISLEPTSFFVTPGEPTITETATPTLKPSRKPTRTGKPSKPPVATTSPPTLSPVAGTTSSEPTLGEIGTAPSPVSAPTAETNAINATGLVYIQLNYVADTMSDDIIKQYEEQCTAFFTQELGNKTPPVTDIVSKLQSQKILTATDSDTNSSGRFLRSISRDGGSRGLQQDLPPLLTLVEVSSMVASEEFASGINDLLYGALVNYPDVFVQLLKEGTTDVASAYFQLVQEILPFKGDDPNAGQPIAPTSVSAPSPAAPVAAPTRPVTAPTPAAPVASPTKPAAPTTSNTTTPPKSTTSNSTSTGESSNDTLSVGGVVGIVLVVCFGITVAVAVLMYTSQSKEEEPTAAPVKPGGGATAASSSKSFQPNAKVSRKVSVPPGKLGIVIGTSPAGPVVSKINPGSPLEGLLAVGDIIVAVDSVNTKAMSASEITELTSKTMSQQRTLTVLSDKDPTGGKVSRKVILPPGKMGVVIDTTPEGPCVHKVHPGSALEGMIFPGDIIAAVDSVSTKAMPASELTDLVVRTANQTRTLTILSTQGIRGKVSRKVTLPPGKMGVVIDTTQEGPVVHKVHAGSPLEGLVYPGDVIIGVDQTSTTAMTASALTDLMTKTFNQERILTILSDESSEGGKKVKASLAPAGPRKVKVPPGKLGIVIDTTPKGPVVHKIHPGSPLEGLAFPGDYILAVDDVDTTAMSAAAITALMVQTGNQHRVLTVSTGESGGEGAGAVAVVPVPTGKEDEAAAVPPANDKQVDEEPEIVVEEPGSIEQEEEVAVAPSGQADELEATAPKLMTRTVNAPPGKLGIVIDTTPKGPVVHQVHPESPLTGLVRSGDIIMAVDEVDTRAMSASAITALMVKTSNQKRTLTVLSEE